MKVVARTSLKVWAIAAVVSWSFSVDAGERLDLDCPASYSGARAEIKVKVTENTETSSFIYEYEVDTRKKKIIGFYLKDVSSYRTIRPFADWSLCAAPDGTICLSPKQGADTDTVYTMTVESDAPPGIVRYSALAPNNNQAVAAQFERIVNFFSGDEEAAREAMDDAIERDCRYGKRLSLFDKGRTGVTIGPSHIPTVALEPSALMPTLGVSVLKLPTTASNATAFSFRSFEALTPSLRPVKAEIELGSRASPFELSSVEMPDCDIDGLLVRVIDLSGQERRGGIKLAERDCEIRAERFTVEKSAVE